MNLWTCSNRGSLGVCIAAILFCAASARADGPAPSPAQARYEIRFLTGMIDHHHMAVMTSELCMERAVNPELIELCEQIHAAQMAEIELMQDWLQEWYGITYEPQMKPGGMKMVERLASLSGEEFEIEFMTMMIRHHFGAVREGLHCLHHAYHEELRELCHDMVVTQTEEILLMQEWLCDWYGICHQGMHTHA